MNNIIDNPVVLYTDHFVNKYLSDCFSTGAQISKIHIDNFNDFSKTVVVYGYLRGTGDAIKKSRNFYYIDHGYFKQSQRSFKGKQTIIDKFDGYFRIVYNDFWHSGKGNMPSDRFEKLNLKFKTKKNDGEFIILSEPIDAAKKYYNLHNWLEETLFKLKNLTDRKIFVHSRESNIPLKAILPKAWAFVSDHSSAGFLSMLEGVPAYFTNTTLSNIGPIEKIEDHEINYNAFYNLAYEQWTIDEIKSGETWDYLKNKSY